ncbi:hypothetical protein Hs30E_20710 [Lactococcus hodotermopsidis]|uniref:Uncharacterized protein n=1 Tax=Pseudolactococcus hodotermopsidis TaxID=2709157 RepID=A0A6A0BGU0_9LACT|nr:hypothetical protein [Lactococcus hodotermopsidis]GFH43491.1 hypothetical protein Hs30E_20710 [Lactococcus hodotermopsidis]
MLNTIIMVDKKNYITLLKNDNGQYIVEWSDGAAHVYSELVATLDANEVISGKKELVSLAFKAKNGAWPPTEEQNRQGELEFLLSDLQMVHDISLPNDPNLFEEFPELKPEYEKWLSEQ